jgi:hypothetical protein
MILETLGGGLLGGLFRLAPEVIKIFDAKNERSHELKMLEAEMAFAKLDAEREMHRTDSAMTVAELDAMGAALKEQGQTARSAGWFVAAISALVRPLVTYWFVVMYSVVKIVGIYLAVRSGGLWTEVLVTSWNSEDMAILTMILTFWFVGRVYERSK